MRYGDLVVTTAVYRSQCDCAHALEMARGEECPACPRCEAPVDWAYERSTFRSSSPAGQDEGTTSGRPPIRASVP